MADNCSDCESANAYRIRLTLLASKGRGNTLDRIISSLTNWVDPSKQIVDVDEMLPDQEDKSTKSVPNVKGCLVTPALSIMLFMRETGNMCVYDAEKILKKAPWMFHHKVELQNIHAPKTSVAKQEFFKLADDLPLFAACPVLSENEHLRINLYVHDFSAMVEFYRTITDTEIETNKPDFCIFEIYRQDRLDIQLSLKRSPYIYPRPVESAYVSFNVKNIKMVTLGTSCHVEHVGSNVYTVRDPDGNLVVLYETTLSHSNDCCTLAGACSCSQGCLISQVSSCDLASSASFDDVKSFKSTTESQDSGRYSDLEGTQCESGYVLDNSIKQKDKFNRGRGGDKTIKSEGYASSSSSTVCNEAPASKVKTSTKTKVQSKNVNKSKNVVNRKVPPRTPREVKRGNVAPVYI
ncbi:hypothetical protein ACF0H5_016346 [Mactra antiquata]